MSLYSVQHGLSLVTIMTSQKDEVKSWVLNLNIRSEVTIITENVLHFATGN